MSPMQALLIFLGIPLAVYAVVTLLVYAPGWGRSPKYRPGVTWFAEAVWFNGPADVPTALQAAEPAPDAGGTSARW
jgi:hypothetical protein